jgi:hypothetical protein
VILPSSIFIITPPKF